MNASIAKSVDGSAATVTVSGELDLATTGTLKEVIWDQFAQGRDVELNLAEVSFIDSTALATIVNALNEAQRLQCRFTLHSTLQQQPRRLMELTHVLASLTLVD